MDSRAVKHGYGYSHGETGAVPKPAPYCEWHGIAEGVPLVLAHSGDSTIESNWGRLIDQLKGSRWLSAVELQGHGRTATGIGHRPSNVTRTESACSSTNSALGGRAGVQQRRQVAMQLAMCPRRRP